MLDWKIDHAAGVQFLVSLVAFDREVDYTEVHALESRE